VSKPPKAQQQKTPPLLFPSIDARANNDSLKESILNRAYLIRIPVGKHGSISLGCGYRTPVPAAIRLKHLVWETMWTRGITYLLDEFNRFMAVLAVDKIYLSFSGLAATSCIQLFIGIVRFSQALLYNILSAGAFDDFLLFSNQ
jgi:hypothetical protein